MSIHSFTVSADFTDDLDSWLDRLYEAGGDDATVSADRVGTRAEIAFDREASSFAAAIFSALDTLLRSGARPKRIMTDEYVGASEIAERLGVTRQSVSQLVNGDRGPGGFPNPVFANSGKNRLWRWSEVAIWWQDWKHVDLLPGRDQAAVAEMANGALQILDGARHLDEGDRTETVERVQRLVADQV